MTFFEIYLYGLIVIMVMMSLLWVCSIAIRNVSIVDPFWGIGFVLAGLTYFFYTDTYNSRKFIIVALLLVWGLRLSIFLGWRNWGKGEDFRYQQFRRDYGPHRYWWFSFFQVFLLQGVLCWLISAPLLAAMYYMPQSNLNFLDYLAVIFWILGFAFEAGGDYQLSRFKSNPANKGKVLNRGFWKYSRHPNYFGDATIWWAFALFAVAAGSYITLSSALLMTLLILKISGLALLERTLKESKPHYKSYIEKTSAFIPWFPKK